MRRIAADLVTDMGLELGPLDVIPEDATFDNFYWGGLPSAGAMNVLLRRLNIKWRVVDGVVNFYAAGDPAANPPTRALEFTPILEGDVLTFSFDTDYQDASPITVEVRRTYQATGGDGRADTFSREYLTECQTLAQWRHNPSVELDEEEWAEGLKAQQDGMALAGNDWSFTIDRVDEHLEVSVAGREKRVLKPRKVIAARSNYVAADGLEVGTGYYTIGDRTPLMPPSFSPISQGDIDERNERTTISRVPSTRPIL